MIQKNNADAFCRIPRKKGSRINECQQPLFFIIIFPLLKPSVPSLTQNPQQVKEDIDEIQIQRQRGKNGGL